MHVTSARRTALFLAAALATHAFADDDPSATPTEDRPAAEGQWKLELRLGASAGAFHGMNVRRDSGRLALLEGLVRPSHKEGDWTVEIPVRFHHRQTFGASLSETYGSAGVEVQNRVDKGFRIGAEAGAAGVWRPAWPDLYQPDPNAFGKLLPTDRFSYLAPRAGVNLRWTPVARNHVHLRYRYVLYSFLHDPNFNEQADPMHLTPRDNGQHQFDASYRVVSDAYAAAFRLDYVRRNDSVYLAKDAVSGSTNFYTNPKQQLAQLEPSVEVELKRLGGAMDVSLQYGYEMQDDLFQGYYSYTGHHPRLLVDWKATERIGLRAKGELWWREYGPDSKAAGLPPDPTIGHLESGTRLYDHRGALSGALSFAVGGGLSLKAEGEYVARDTNYPDYVPGVFPATRYYDIQWDYTNWQVLAGVEYRR